MNNKPRLIFLLLLVFVIGCQPSAAESVEPLAISPSATSLPPTHTKIPPTHTPVSTATPSPEPTRISLSSEFGYEEIYLTSRDGVQLFGALYQPPEAVEAKPLVVILGHMMGSSHFTWRSFGQLLAENGFTALVISFRGYYGSDGVKDLTTVGPDMIGAVDYFTDQGYERIACIGASMGGTACLIAGVENHLAGIVNLSGPMNIPGTSVLSLADMQNLTMPKMFVIAEEDIVVESVASFVDDFLDMHDAAAEPKELIVYPGIAHGNGMFNEEYGVELQETIITFLNNIAELEK
jgi:esterase/lipase